MALQTDASLGPAKRDLPECQPGTGLVIEYLVDRKVLIESWNDQTSEHTLSTHRMGEVRWACGKCATRLQDEGSKIAQTRNHRVGESFYCGYCHTTHLSTHSGLLN